MSKIKRLFALALLLLFFVAQTALPVGATDGEVTPTRHTAEILEVQGGAGGIVSLTFDDGYYATAKIVDELAKKYDLTASLMMTSLSFNTGAYKGEGATLEEWREFFANSPLEPQSHTMSHADLEDPDLQSEEDFERELLVWRDTLEEYFPEYDVITLAMPYGRMSEAAVEYAGGVYYTIRSTAFGAQTLDPDFSGEYGSWQNLYSPVVRAPGGTEEQQLEYIKGCISMNEHGWYAPIIHRVGEHSESEMSYAMTEAVFAHIASLRDEGKVWVTTFSEATKYIRERQNATAYYYEDGGRVYACASLSDYTADGLHLDPEIFDTPLTLKVEIPDYYTEVYYTERGVEYKGKIVENGSKRYTLVDIIPDGSPVELRPTYSHEMGDWERCDEDNHKKVCAECGMIEYEPHTPDEGVITTPSEHITEGVRTHLCTVCGEDSTSAVERTPDHTFDREVKKNKYLVSIQSCTEGRKYYYSCECGECGTETFYSTEPLGHEGEWRVVRVATETADGLEVYYCERCLSAVDERPIPMRGIPETGGDAADTPDTPDVPDEPEAPGQAPDEPKDFTIVIIAVSVGGAVLAGAAVAIIFIILMKKRK